MHNIHTIFTHKNRCNHNRPNILNFICYITLYFNETFFIYVTKTSDSHYEMYLHDMSMFNKY